MNEQNYINYYIEVLTSTMTDAVVRNVSLQAQTKVINEVVENQSKQLDDFYNVINSLKDEINSLKNQNSEMSGFKGEADNAKSQLQHLDTFRNELIKERAAHAESLETIAKLENKIAELQSPAKTKVKKAVTKSILSVEPVEEETLKDGGTF